MVHGAAALQMHHHVAVLERMKMMSDGDDGERSKLLASIEARNPTESWAATVSAILIPYKKSCHSKSPSLPNLQIRPLGPEQRFGRTVLRRDSDRKMQGCGSVSRVQMTLLRLYQLSNGRIKKVNVFVNTGYQTQWLQGGKANQPTYSHASA